MTAVLADLALEVEGATALALRLARAFDAPEDSPERALARIATPAAKYWMCKRAPMVALEAMEVLGGNGYVEETPLARFYREAPVNSIWEGSGNVICLDVMRAVEREPAGVEALADGAGSGRAAATLTSTACSTRCCDTLATASRDAAIARRARAGRSHLRCPPRRSCGTRRAFVADAFCATRLPTAPFAGAAFGTLPRECDARAIVARAQQA